MGQNIVEKKINIYMGVLLFVLAFSYVVCAVWKSPSMTEERLLSLPASYTISSEYLYSDGTGMVYRRDTGEFQIQTGYAQKSVLFLNNKADTWKYLKILVSGMNCESIDTELAFLYEGQCNGRQSAVLKEGEVLLRLQDGMLFDEVVMTFNGQEGKSFHVDRFTFGEQTEEFDWNKYMGDYGKVFFVLLSVVCLIYCVCRRKIHFKAGEEGSRLVSGLSDVIQREAEGCIPGVHLNETTRSIMRRILFVCIFLSEFYLYKLSMRRHYREALLITGVGLLFIAWLAWQEEHQQRRVDAWMAGTWVWLQIVEIFSDIIIPKELRFMGVWQLIVLGTFFFVWAGMKKPEKVLQDFKFAIHVLYMAMTVYCVFFYRYLPEMGQRYSGPFHNPNPFSLACMLGIVAAASDMAKEHGNRSRAGKSILYGLYGIEIAVGVLFIWKSECRTALLALAGFLFMFLVLGLFRWSEKKSRTVRLAVWAGVILFFAAGLAAGVYVMKYVYQRPIDMTSLDSITSGRLNIWGKYIQNWNIWGHARQVTINGNPTYAHNGVLRCINYYGIFAGVAYTLLFVNIIFRLVDVYVHRRVKLETGIVLLGVIFSFFVATMLESVEDVPFIWPNWLAFYWIIGALMRREES